MTTLPLLYLCVRPQAEAASAEYASFLTEMGVDQTVLARHDLVHEPLPDDVFDRFAGFVVGGSPFNVTDPESTKTDTQRRLESDLERVVASAADAQTAALFTCYGIGIVTRLLGGEVSRAFPEDTGPTVVSLTDQGAEDALFGPLATHFGALTAHKEGTAALPPGGVLLATNEACPVQAYRVGDRLYATQFHPETTGEAFIRRMAVYRDDGYFDSRDYDAISARVWATDLRQPPRLLRGFAGAFG